MAGFALFAVLRQGRRRGADSDSQVALAAAAARPSESARGPAVLWRRAVTVPVPLLFTARV